MKRFFLIILLLLLVTQLHEKALSKVIKEDSKNISLNDNSITEISNNGNKLVLLIGECNTNNLEYKEEDRRTNSLNVKYKYEEAYDINNETIEEFINGFKLENYIKANNINDYKVYKYELEKQKLIIPENNYSIIIENKNNISDKIYIVELLIEDGYISNLELINSNLNNKYEKANIINESKKAINEYIRHEINKSEENSKYAFLIVLMLITTVISVEIERKNKA